MRRAAAWIEAHEPWLLAPAVLLLLFPSAWLPLAALALLLMVGAARVITLRQLAPSSPLDLPNLILLVMAVVGWLVSVDRALSSTRLWGIVLCLVVYYALLGRLRDEVRLWQAVRAAALFSAGVAALSFVSTDWGAVRLLNLPLLYDHLPTLVRNLPGSGVPRDSDLVNPRAVGAAMGLLLPVQIALAWFAREPALRRLCAGAALACAVVLLLTQSLQALAGVLVGLGLLAVWRKRQMLWLIPVAVIAAAVVLWTAGIPNAAALLLSAANPVGIAVALRLEMWYAALAMIRDMPLTGIGLNTFPTILSYFYPTFLLGPPPSAHNLYLQTALDLGLPGLLAFAWLLVACIRQGAINFRLNSNLERRALLVGLSAAVLSFLVNGLFDVTPVGSKISPALWAIFALLVAHQEGIHPPLRSAPRRRWPAAIAVPAVAALLLFATAWPLNTATLQAHRALFDSYQSGAPEAPELKAASTSLQAVLPTAQADPIVYDLLGRTDAWLGEDDAAFTALDTKMRLDLQDPYGRYFPAQAWLRRLTGVSGTDSSADLLSIYLQWQARYPERAESYALVALVWQRAGDAERALQTVRAGISQGAEPRSFLQYMLAHMQGTAAR